MNQYILRIFSLLFLLGTILVGCNNDENYIKNLNPNAGSSHFDIENEGYQVSMNATPADEDELGTWRVYVGENGTFEDVNDPFTTFFGEPGENYEIGWEISHGNRYEASTITVSFKGLEPEIVTAPTDTLVDNISLYLKAVKPKYGASGRWEIVSGEGGRIENSESHLAEFVGQKNKKYTVAWLLSYGAKEEATEISFTTDELRANAGLDNLDVKTPKEDEDRYYTLEAFLPAGATGLWKVIAGEGGHIYSPTIDKSLFKGKADETYELTWNVTLDGITSIDTVNVRFRGKWGVWTDERDGQTYRYTEINGLEWMSENYNYAVYPGTGSWYYGHALRSVIHDGYALEEEDERKAYGRLYGRDAAELEMPDGWRLPTLDEFQELVASQGGALYAKEKMMEGGSTGLDLNLSGTLDISSSSDPAFRNVFSNQEIEGMYWTSEKNENNGFSTVLYVGISDDSYGLISIAYDYAAISLRYVREVQ
ncbi:FISUMP domain-containing protein [Reichenbachiella sp.]